MDKRSELLNKKKEWSTRNEKEETKQENAFFWMQITTRFNNRIQERLTRIF